MMVYLGAAVLECSGPFVARNSLRNRLNVWRTLVGVNLCPRSGVFSFLKTVRKKALRGKIDESRRAVDCFRECSAEAKVKRMASSLSYGGVISGPAGRNVFYVFPVEM